MKKLILLTVLIAAFVLIGIGYLRYNSGITLVPIDEGFVITNIGDATKTGDPVSSLWPIYAEGCDVYGMNGNEPLRYSKIDFFVAEDVKNTPTILLGTTMPGGGGSGECDLSEAEVNHPFYGEPGTYRVWAVRYIGETADKRSAEVKIRFAGAEDANKKLYTNKQYGFSFQYLHRKIAVQEVEGKLENGLYSVRFLSASNASEGDRNINAGLRVFLNIPNVAFGRYTLEDLLAGRDIEWQTLIGFSPEYQWQCGDSENVGRERIRSCYLQKGKNVYEFDYNYTSDDILSRAEYDAIVQSFRLD